MIAFNTEAMKAALAGVSIFVSAGDNGASGMSISILLYSCMCEYIGDNCWCTVESGSTYSTWPYDSAWSGEGYFPSFPATSPYVTAVGGTMGPNSGIFVFLVLRTLDDLLNLIYRKP